jgi:DNA repair protein RadC
VSIGGLSGTVADVRTIFQAALVANACSIILAHNHPSGNGTPSQADIQLTERMKGAGLIMEIPLLDHIILLSEGYFSMADQGML